MPDSPFSGKIFLMEVSSPLATLGVKRMTRSDSEFEEPDVLRRLREVVNDYVKGLDEIVTFVLLSTPDGIPVVTTLDAGTAINEFLSASGSAISEIASSYSEYSGSGKLSGVIISGDKGHVVLKRLDDHLILAIGFLSRNLSRSLEISVDIQEILSSIIQDEKEGG